MQFKFPISQFKIVSVEIKNAILLFQYTILHRKSSIRQFNTLFDSSNRLLSTETCNPSFWNYRSAIQTLYSSIQTDNSSIPTCNLLSQTCFSTMETIWPFNLITLLITSNSSTLFPNSQLFNANVTFQSLKHAVLRRRLGPSPATHAYQKERGEKGGNLNEFLWWKWLHQLRSTFTGELYRWKMSWEDLHKREI